MPSIRSSLVSVIIPVFNGENYLADAIVSALGQTHQNLEVVVLNDGSTDKTQKIAEHFAATDSRVKLIHQVNQGLSAARNAGIRTANGDYFSFLDHDDVIEPTKLELQLNFLAQNPDCGLVYSDYDWVDTELQLIESVIMGTPPLPLQELYLFRNWFTPVVPLLRRSLVESVGEFDETLCGAEDWDYWIRGSAISRFGYAPGIVAKYRSHPKQMHREFELMRKARLQVLGKHFKSQSKEFRLGLASIYWNEFQFFKPRRELLPLITAASKLLKTRIGLLELRTIAKINSN